MITQENFKRIESIMHDIRYMQKSIEELKQLKQYIAENCESDKKYQLSLVAFNHMSYHKDVDFYKVNKDKLIDATIAVIESDVEELLKEINEM